MHQKCFTERYEENLKNTNQLVLARIKQKKYPLSQGKLQKMQVLNSKKCLKKLVQTKTSNSHEKQNLQSYYSYADKLSKITTHFSDPDKYLKQMIVTEESHPYEKLAYKAEQYIRKQRGKLHQQSRKDCKRVSMTGRIDQKTEDKNISIKNFEKIIQNEKNKFLKEQVLKDKRNNIPSSISTKPKSPYKRWATQLAEERDEMLQMFKDLYNETENRIVFNKQRMKNNHKKMVRLG